MAVSGFWLALRQDVVRWAREKRAELCIDLLAEAHAENLWIAKTMTEVELRLICGNESFDDDVIAETDTDLLPDTRMDAAGRALLGARMAAFASDDVVRLFNRIGAGMPLLVKTESDAHGFKIKAGIAFDALEKRIRTELRAGRRTWRGGLPVRVSGK